MDRTYDDKDIIVVITIDCQSNRYKIAAAAAAAAGQPASQPTHTNTHL